MLRIKSNEKLRKYITLTFVAIFITAISMVGVTYAWFTSGPITLENIFRAGTIQIEVTDKNINGFQPLVVEEEENCTQLKYEINKTGTKTSYVRAKFEGYWKRDYHYNKVSATAFYNNQKVYTSDELYFKYDYSGFEPNIEIGDTSDFVGFHTSRLLNKIMSDTIPINTDLDEGPPGPNGNQSGEPVLPDCDDDQYPLAIDLLSKDSSNDLPDYDKYFYDGNLPEVYNQSDLSESNLIKNLYKPDNCNLQSLKLKTLSADGKFTDTDLADDNIGDGIYHYIHNDGFEIKVERRTYNGKTTFAFATNYPVLHVFTKGGGGRVGGNLYRYFNPDSDYHRKNGVLADCGLKQPDGGWSHITVFYCKPDFADPALEIEKEIQDKNGKWVSAKNIGDAPFIPADPDVAPKFRFTVTNTGDVDLDEIIVEDSLFGVIDNDLSLSALPPHNKETYEREYPGWMNSLSLNTDNVTVEVEEFCNVEYGYWVPTDRQQLGTYFYYIHPIRSGHEPIPLCVNVCFEKDDEKYQGAYLTIYPYFEAVQASHPDDMVENNWPVFVDNDGKLSLE